MGKHRFSFVSDLKFEKLSHINFDIIQTIKGESIENINYRHYVHARLATIPASC